MPDDAYTQDQKIDRDRRKKWAEYRRKHGMAEDAPFIGKDPWEETYEEMLDALNYLDQVPGTEKTTPEFINARWCVRLTARICLRHMIAEAR